MEDLSNLVNWVATKYSCRYSGEIVKNNGFGYVIRVKAHKGKTTVSYKRIIDLYFIRENYNYFNNVYFDLEEWFKFYFIRKNDFTVYSQFDKRISRDPYQFK